MTEQKDYLRDTYYNWYLGTVVAQYFADFYLWEVFFCNNPIRHLIELGTYHGGMASFLMTQCYGRGIGFDTFDILPEPECFNRPLQKALGLSNHFHRGSIFEENFELVKTTIETSPRPFALFCDDGDKPKEFRLFAPFLKSGDFVIVHDWQTEFFEKDITIPVERLLIDQCEALKSLTIFMKVK